MNTNPAPERTWSLSSKNVKALSHASGSDYVYALTEDEVSDTWIIYSASAVIIHTPKQPSNSLPHPPAMYVITFLHIMANHPAPVFFSSVPHKGPSSPSGGVL